MRRKIGSSIVFQLLIIVFLAAVAFAAPGDGGGDGVGDGEGNPDAKRPGMFRKNVSRTPEMTSTKSKLNTMRVWFPALRADGEPATYADDDGNGQNGIPYYDYTCTGTDEETGECLEWERNLIRVAIEAKPIVVVYTDAVEETGCEDVFAAISRDDGKTFKRKNLSRMADRSSFTIANGEECYGQVKKPVFQICGNNILVAWTSKFCKGGKPTYAIDTTDDYIHDDPYWEDDIYGVAGPQRSKDYTEGTGPIADYPEVGEVPYSCVWVVRGTIVTQGMINSGADDGFWAQYPVGHIIWFKPERLTSGRRDAIQAFMGMGDGAGFGLTWQEDPAGLRPGKMAGPGHGWSGATVHHKTDVWYSFMTQADFRRIDTNYESGGLGVHDSDNYIADRPKALVPMPLPVRISDNDVVNTDSMQVQLYENGYPVVHSNGNFIPLDGGSSITEVSYAPEDLTRCVKFEGDETIAETDSLEPATYHVLPELPAEHNSSMNCTNCHVPFDTDGTHDASTQGAPIPLVVVDAATSEYLGGFTNSDCVSCHYDHVVPRDRVIAVASGTITEKCAECADKGGIWKDGTQGGDNEIIEAYYPYEGYPYIAGADDSSGTHRYGYMLAGMCDNYKQSVLDNGGNETTEPDWENVDVSNWYDFINNQGAEKRVLVTDDSRLLDGDTGASRPNLFLKPFTRSDGSKGAWAIMAYEETKGVGAGPPFGAGESEDGGEQPEDGSGDGDDRYFPDNGKNVIYHSFEYTNPDKVSAGNIVNLPERNADGSLGYLYEVERDENGVPLTDEDGNFIPIEPTEYLLDFQGNPQLAYENARRPRFIIQGKSAIGASGTVMVVLYKEGQEGMGRQSDIMMRRFVVPSGQTGNPYRFSNLVCNAWATAHDGTTVCVDGCQNMSSVTVCDTPQGTSGFWVNPNAEPDSKGDNTKVVCWKQLVENLNDKSDTNPYDDARAHRGAIRGDFILMGYSWTPNWASARNAHDKYDFHIRRSFDGGETWTTDLGGNGTTHVDTFKIYEEGETDDEEVDNGREKYDVTTTYEAGAFEAALNISQLPNNKESVIEPRIVGTPSTIKAGGQPTGFPEDVQNQNVFYLTFGTATNVPKPHGSSDDEAEELESAVPADLFYTFTQDKGETFVETSWVVQGDPQGEEAPETGDTVTGWDWLAKGDPEQGEAQIRMTPDGSRFYATWLQESEIVEDSETEDGGIDQGDGIGSADGSDIWFRRIMPGEFPCNVANVVSGTTVDEDEATPLADISVRIYQQDVGLLDQTVTNEDGAFTFNELSEESYVVTVEGNSAGFEEPVVNVTLSADSPKARLQFKKKSGVPGDLDEDGDVDSGDYIVFRSTLGKCAGDAGFNSAADYDGDGCITYADYRIWYGYFRS